MSSSLRVQCDAPPNLTDMVADLYDGEVACLGGGIPGADWNGQTVRLYIPARSTRTTDVSHGEGHFEVVIRSPATVEDHLLAAGLAYRVASRARSDIDFECFGVLPRDEFRAQFGQEWAESGEASGFGSYIRVAEHVGGALEASGPRGGFGLGPRLLAELRDGQDGLAAWQRLKRRMLEFHDPTVRHASLFQVKQADGAGRILAFWYPHESMILPAAEQVVLAREDGEPVFHFPWDDLSGVAAGHLRLVDESQPLIHAFTADEWPALLDRARAVGTPLGSTRPGPQTTQER